jgi:hypothetical protein
LADQIKRQRPLVINPRDLVTERGNFRHQPAWWPAHRLPVDYLVITDGQTWDPVAIAPIGAVDGDPVAEFDRLIAWKRARGLTTRLVTVTDIVAGVYGDFRTGALDLQEVIRSFLRYAFNTWGPRWLLLGGDTPIIPVRVADGGYRGEIVSGSEPTPEAGSSYWTGARLIINTTGLDDWWFADAGNILLGPDGVVIPHRDAAAPGDGWRFASDDTYQTVQDAPSDFVVVTGAQDSLTVPLRFLYKWNQIPTDFYYASLVGSGYGLPGKHDWDLRANGIYGEHAATAGADPDSISWQADLSVGRAPIQCGAEAATFVDKILQYEQLAPVTTFPRLDPCAAHSPGSARMEPVRLHADRFVCGSAYVEQSGAARMGAVQPGLRQRHTVRALRRHRDRRRPGLVFRLRRPQAGGLRSAGAVRHDQAPGGDADDRRLQHRLG